MFNTNNHIDGIDIYLYYDQITPHNLGLANGGVGESSEFLVSGNNIWGPPAKLPYTHVVSHEMGHVLNLYHTHRHPDLEGPDDGVDACEEFVDDSNDDVCGDLAEDTPADPNIDQNVDLDCNWLGSAQDSHGDAYNPDPLNIMSYTTPQCMEYITDDQGRRARDEIANSQILANCRVLTIPHEYFSNTTIDNHQEFQNDIIVYEGVELTITGSISMAEDKKIIMKENAKLIVDGGIISTHCGHEWSGIKVTGGNSDFDVKIINGAIIENTNAAAVSMFADLPYPDITDYGNGILHAEDSYFNNTRRLVEFMSWDAMSFNTSYIKNCTQNGGHWGITNWNCWDILIDGNTFNDITGYGIVTDYGSMIINNNTFDCYDHGILFNNVSATKHSEIQNNIFNGTKYGVNARGLTLNKQYLHRNLFNTLQYGAYFDGANKFVLNGSDFYSHIGITCINNGPDANPNHIRVNDFIGNSIGIDVHRNNSDLLFYYNCFNCQNTDVSIKGSVNEVIFGFNQSGNETHANNCFTHQGNSSSFIQDISGNPIPFDYIEPDDAPNVDCRDAVLAHPSVNRVPDGVDEGLPDCGRSNIGGGSQINSYCFPNLESIDSIASAFSWIQNELDEIDSNTELTENEREFLTSVYEDCYYRVRDMLVESYVENEQFDQARSIFSSDTSDYANVMIYSIYVLENDLSQASTYLSSISNPSQKLSDFIDIQSINLNRLPFGPFYQASQNELNTVLTIANKTHEYAGFAKALYYVLTGIVITSNSTSSMSLQNNDKMQNNLQSSDFAEDQFVKNISIHPNPFTSELQIESNNCHNCSLQIINQYGQVLYSKKDFDGSFNVDTQSFLEGIYIAKINKGNQIITIKKLLLIR